MTTSVNISGEAHITDPKQIKEEIAKEVNYCIDNGVLEKKSSTVIDLRTKEILRK